MTTIKFTPDVAAIEREAEYFFAQARKGFKSEATLLLKSESARMEERETYRRTARGLRRRAEQDEAHARYLMSRVVALRAKGL